MKVTLTKKVLVSTVAATLTLGIAVGAYADSALKQVIAYQNSALQIKVNGKQIDQSSEDGTMYPLVYEGHSYVSAKALAEALGATVKWNNDTQTVEVTGNGNTPKEQGLPTKDNSTKTTPSTAQTPASPAATSAVISYDSIPDQVTLTNDFLATGDAILNAFLAAFSSNDNSALKETLNKIGYENSTYHGPELNFKEISEDLVQYKKRYSPDEIEKIANGGVLAIKNKDYNIKPELKVDSDKTGFYLSYSYVIYYNKTYSTIYVRAKFNNELVKGFKLKDISVGIN
ncbi:stalk domain-containing protein [Paenibacillus tyrfis]|uniref:stalk domain-containing protein n=1 Tax=Paenibacillus tyrfis TaxID=1501230 RepID=UPI00209F5598|nr:stalk domain-containing protein [Paenibacillus tyrfis]MCP1309838.1 copper amine oxidase N-terminal domain-containing protein [Paenibacillus tyrfis]